MNNNKLATSIWEFGENKVRFTWYPGDDLKTYTPFNQVYGVCFNDGGKILIQKLGDSEWSLPGGTVEEGESPVDTLKRELLEETDVSIKNPILLGGQRVQFLKGHHTDTKRGGNDFYQLRYYCEVDKLMPQTPDPDHDEIHDRLFVRPEDITRYFDWEDPGREIFKQAVEIYKRNHKR